MPDELSFNNSPELQDSHTDRRKMIAIIVAAVAWVGSIGFNIYQFNVISNRNDVISNLNERIKQLDEQMAHTDATVKNYLVYKGIKCEESAENCITKLTDSLKRVDFTKRKNLVNPIVWQEAKVGAQFHVTAVSVSGGNIGRTLISPQESGYYGEREPTYNITLYLTIDTQWERVIPIHLRLIDADGNLLLPNTQQYIFPDTNGNLAKANTTYRDQQLVFIAPVSLGKLTFTTVGNDGVFFTVEILPNKDIDVREGL